MNPLLPNSTQIADACGQMKYPLINKRRKSHILLVIASISGAGAELVVSYLCKTLDPKRWKVTVCHLKERGEKGDQLVAQGYQVVGLPGIDPSKPNYLSFIKLIKLIKILNVDIVHSHNLQALFDCALCKWFTPNVKYLHTYHFGNYPNLPFRYLFLEGLFSRIPDQLVAVGTRQKGLIQKSYYIRDRKIKTVYNGISITKSNEDKKLRNKLSLGKDIIIGAISTLINQKGVDILLKAISRLKTYSSNLQFVIVGDGPLRTSLERQCRELGVENMTTFLGWVPNAANIILPCFDIFIQTSRWEAMSMVVLEAMSAGKPIIATDVGENHKVIQDGVSGYIVEKDNIDTIVDRLIKLIKDSERRRIFGKNAKERVSKDFSVETMIFKYEQLYEQLLSK